MKNYFVKMMLIAAALFVFSVKFVDVTFGDNGEAETVSTEGRLHIMEKAWRKLAIPADRTSLSIDAWAAAGKEYLSGAELASLGRRIGAELGVLWDKNSAVQRDDKEFAYWNQQGKLEGLTVTLIVQSQKGSPDGEPETNLGITLLGNYEKGKICRITDRLEQVLPKYGNKTIGIVMQGCVEKEVSEAEKASAGHLVKQALSGRIIPGIVEEGLAGYTPLLRDAIDFSGEKINWQLIWRDSLESDETEVILATPMYLQEY